MTYPVESFLKITEKEIDDIFLTFADELIIFKNNISSKEIVTEKDKAIFLKGMKDIGQLRRDIETKRKEINAPALAFTKTVNSLVKKLSVEVNNIEATIKKKLTLHAETQAKKMEEELESSRKAAAIAAEEVEKIRKQKEKEAQELREIEEAKQRAIEEKILAEKAAEKARLKTEEQEDNLFIVDAKTIEAEDRLKALEAEREAEEHRAKEKAIIWEKEEQERIDRAIREEEERKRKQHETEIELAKREYAYKTDWDIIDFKKLPDDILEERKEHIKKAIAPAINPKIKAGMREIPGIKINVTKTIKA